MSAEFIVKYKTRNINSKRLLKEIQKIAEEVSNEYISVRSLSSTYEYEEFVIFFEAYLDDLLQKKKITQFDIIADGRNNDANDVAQGLINIAVKFRQTNCINLTRIDMQFTLDQ